MSDLNIFLSAIQSAFNSAVKAAVEEATRPTFNQVQCMDTDLTALKERIAALENQAIVASNRINDRIDALENNPAQGVDTSVVAGNYTPISNEQIKVALQEWATTGGFVTRDDVAELIAEAMDDHTSTYDHDDYDSHISDDDKHFEGDIEDAVRDALSNMTFDVSIR